MTSDTQVPPYMTLNNGQKVSSIALGCYNPDDPPGIVHGIEAAVKVGYTHFDDAALYKNEKEVGDALRASGIPREKLFVTTKIWNFDHHNVEAAFDRSFDALNLGYIDILWMIQLVSLILGNSLRSSSKHGPAKSKASVSVTSV